MLVKFYIPQSCVGVAAEVLGSFSKENGCLELEDTEMKSAFGKLNKFMATSDDVEKVDIAGKIAGRIVDVAADVGVDLLGAVAAPIEAPVEQIALEKTVTEKNAETSEKIVDKKK